MPLSARSYPQGVTVQFEHVTPDMAEEWLSGLNVNNRHFSSRLSDLYAKSMLEDRWYVNGETIGFSTDGRLLNGQHRLSGIVRSGQALWLLVVRNLEPVSQETMDGGRKRRAGDVLSLLGYANYNALASAARLTLHLGTPDMPRVFSNADVVGAVEAYPGLVKVSQMTLPSVPLSPSPKIYTYWRITEVAPVRGVEFFALLESLANLPEDSPILALHKRLVAYGVEGKAGDGWTRRQETVAMVFRAWNAWVSGHSLSVIRIPRIGGRVVIPELISG